MKKIREHTKRNAGEKGGGRSIDRRVIMAKIMPQILQSRIQSERAKHALCTTHVVREPMKPRSSSLENPFQIVGGVFEKVLHRFSIGEEDDMATLAHSLLGHGQVMSDALTDCLNQTDGVMSLSLRVDAVGDGKGVPLCEEDDEREVLV